MRDPFRVRKLCGGMISSGSVAVGEHTFTSHAARPHEIESKRRTSEAPQEIQDSSQTPVRYEDYWCRCGGIRFTGLRSSRRAPSPSALLAFGASLEAKTKAIAT